MKVKTLALAAGATALFVAGTASASLTLHAELHGTGNPNSWAGQFPDVQVDIYRLYAQNAAPFRVAAWGNPIPGDPFTIMNTNADNTGPGSGFWKVGSQPNTLPVPAGYTYNSQPNPQSHDNSTWHTIGVVAGDTYPTIFQEIPDTDPTLGGPQFATPTYSTVGGIVTAPNQANAASVQFGDGDHRVLLAQYTVMSGENVKGENILVAWQDGAGNPQDDKLGLAFTTKPVVPAPGALALLGMAGLVGTRRRRA